MECLVVSLEIRFQKPLDLFSPERVLQTAITGKEPPRAAATANATYRFDLVDENLAIIVDGIRWAVLRQGRIEGAIEAIMRQLRRAETIIGKAEISRIGVRSHWLTPYTGPEWADLLGQYRRAFLADRPVSTLGGDVSVVIEPENWPAEGIRIQTGPMKRAQLDGQYLLYPDKAEQRPELMFFADVDVAKKANGVVRMRDVEEVARDGLRQARQVTDDLEQAFVGAK